MPKFSEYFSLGLSQHQLDFVDVSNEYDTPVYVDPYAIEIRNDIWAAKASEYIRSFFIEVLNALRDEDDMRAKSLMSHMQEPKETFLGVSIGKPKGRGVGATEAARMIASIKASKAYRTGLLSDLSEMSLFVDGIDRDKISDLTTNIIRILLVSYTHEQCALYRIEMQNYNGPALWDNDRMNWISDYVQLPYIGTDPVLLVPKYIVRRKLSLDSQEFYNKQITDYLIAENLRANTSLVQTIKSKAGDKKKVYKKDVRNVNPKSKSMLADLVRENPDLLDAYKDMAKRSGALSKFTRMDELTVEDVCELLIEQFKNIPPGTKHANDYHMLAMGTITVLFYPDLIQPHKEWAIHGNRKRIDIVYTNAADSGFFSQRRDDANVNANTVIVECKNYSKDIANAEIDQLYGRFDENRGKLGIITCREIDNVDLINKRCKDISVRKRGYIIVLTDTDLITMLNAKFEKNNRTIHNMLHEKFRILLE